MTLDPNRSREILVRTPLVLRRWLAGLNDEWLFGDYGPGTFSPHDVLGHLIHGERADWIPRALILAHGEMRPFEPFDRYAQFEESRGKSVAALLDEFEDARARSLRALDALHITPELLARHGRHPALGTVTLAELLATWAAHDLNHVAQIARCLAAQLAVAVGPWRAYLGILNQPVTRMDDEGVRRKAAAASVAPQQRPNSAGDCGALVPYAPRSIRFRGVREFAGWRFKEYSITLADEPFRETDFAAGVRAALAELPAEPIAAGRPGVGFLILHAGRGALYVVLAWWDHENELPLRICVRSDGEEAWRPAGSRESVCVWDLEVIAFERQAYLDTILAPRPNPSKYLTLHVVS